MSVNIKLVGHKTYVYAGDVFKQGIVYSVSDDKWEDLQEHQTDDFTPVFVATEEEAGPAAEDKPKPLRQIVFGKKGSSASGARGSVGTSTTQVSDKSGQPQTKVTV